MSLTKSEVTTIVDNAIENITNKLKSDLSKQLNDEISKLIDLKIAAFKVTMDAELESIKADNKKLKADYERMHADLTEVIKEQVREKIKLLDLQIHSRKYNVLVPKIAESRGETEVALMGKFRDILRDVVKLPGDMLKDVTFKAAHRLGKKDDDDKCRTSIFVFDKLIHVQEFWRRVRKLGKTEYNFNTHLPIELAIYRSELLKERKELKADNIVARVWEDKGYPVLERKVNGEWELYRSYKRDKLNVQDQ